MEWRDRIQEDHVAAARWNRAVKARKQRRCWSFGGSGDGGGKWQQHLLLGALQRVPVCAQGEHGAVRAAHQGGSGAKHLAQLDFAAGRVASVLHRGRCFVNKLIK